MNRIDSPRQVQRKWLRSLIERFFPTMTISSCGMLWILMFGRGERKSVGGKRGEERKVILQAKVDYVAVFIKWNIVLNFYQG